jgi:hypothetical protein
VCVKREAVLRDESDWKAFSLVCVFVNFDGVCFA